MSNKQIAQAYSELDKVLRRIVELEEQSGRRGTDNAGSYMLTDYLVIAATQGIDGDGDPSTGISFMLPNDQELPLYRLMGLIEFGRNRVNAMTRRGG